MATVEAYGHSRVGSSASGALSVTAELLAHAAVESTVEGDADFLSESHASLLQALLPPGIAFTREPDAELTKLVRALSYTFARFDRYAVEYLLNEIDPRTTRHLLSDWERVFGLPGDCEQPTTIEGRQAALHAKWLGYGDPNSASFEEIAAALGYELTPKTFQPFGAGSSAGDPCYDASWRFAWKAVYHPGDNDTVLACRLSESTQAHAQAVMVPVYDVWRKRTPDASYAYDFKGVAFDGVSTWCAVGERGEIQTSSDGGKTWTAQTAAGGFGLLFDTFHGVTYGNGLWVAVGYQGEIQTSPDGITWTQRTAAGSYIGNFRCVAYHDGLFVAAGSGGEIQKSSNGTTWSVASSTTYTGGFYGISHADGVWVVVGSGGEIETSTDASTWTQRTPAGGFSDYFNAVFNHAGRWLIGGTAGALQSSDDGGVTWENQSVAGQITGSVTGITSDGEVACLCSSTEEVQTSLDGATWRNRTLTEAGDTFSAAAWDGATTICLVGYNGTIFTSDKEDFGA